MRKLALLVAAAAVLGLVLAHPTPVSAAGKTHQLEATVVSVDIEGKKLSFKDDKGEEKTAPVLGKAIASLKTLKAGDKVNITCQDNAKGEHEGVSAIKVEKS